MGDPRRSGNPARRAAAQREQTWRDRLPHTPRALVVGVLIAVAIGVVVLTRDLGGSDAPAAAPSGAGSSAAPVASGPVASLEEFCGAVQTMANAHAAQMSTPNDENETALGLAATSLQSMGVPEGTPAAAVEGVRMMIEDALRTGRGEDPLERSEAQNLAYERLGEYLTESCGAA
ncbi:hypothetical protein G5C66_13325 [Nocardioides sp. KC13]|uniref:Uncharacterized protein n=1 Tax=Nocardioides turkmenicus TaxID=2711220 RepID=A0A6M1R156_9ACTN|nr:hypothetical protein [Nocardioides sp. KC13]NGN93720.1 hypothetical protein [Nocardioides sp. KC13]